MQDLIERSEISKYLQAEPEWKQLVFLLYLSEQTFPEFVRFARANDYPGVDLFRYTIDMGWAELLDYEIEGPRENPLEGLAAIIPDSEDFEGGTSPALVVTHLARFLHDSTFESVVNAGLETVYLLELEAAERVDEEPRSRLLRRDLQQANTREEKRELSEKLRAYQERAVKEHPVLQEGLGKIRAAMEAIKSNDAPHHEMAKGLAREWCGLRTSILGREIEDDIRIQLFQRCEKYRLGQF